MANETVITVVGNLTNDPELKFLPSGAAVVSFTVASTPRTFDRQANEWKNGEALFLRCSAWREMAENIAESLTKGMRVLVQGRLTQRSWEDKNSGEKRSSIELQVDEIGPSLRWASAQVSAKPRSGGNQGGFSAAPAAGGYGGGHGGFPAGPQGPAVPAGPAAGGYPAPAGGGYPAAGPVQPAAPASADPWSNAPSADGGAPFGANPPF
ncbi:MAG: single-stranded DNA-binding protein [Cellulomonadaceae bacterium]|jgi:single-strand DNA-binding protein|nr:single-stranded DNA-binding protein [Cellulomonadaceae bacterium]